MNYPESIIAQLIKESTSLCMICKKLLAKHKIHYICHIVSDKTSGPRSYMLNEKYKNMDEKQLNNISNLAWRDRYCRLLKYLNAVIIFLQKCDYFSSVLLLNQTFN